VSDTAAPTGVIQIWGFNSLHDATGLAAAMELSTPNNVAFTDADTLMIILWQTATTAQLRGATITGSIQ